MTIHSPLPKLYHVSPQRFDSVSIKTARARLLEMTADPLPSKSPNGSMGFWVSPYPKLCAGFGPEVAEVAINPDARLIAMSSQQLRRAFWDTTEDLDLKEIVHAHANLGDELSRLGDILIITDATEEVGEVVILNESAILALNWDCGICLETHRGESFHLHKLVIDGEASRLITLWHFLPDGSLEKSAKARSLAMR